MPSIHTAAAAPPAPVSRTARPVDFSPGLADRRAPANASAPPASSTSALADSGMPYRATCVLS